LAGYNTMQYDSLIIR